MSATPSLDKRWMTAALTLSERSRGLSEPNPNVGCVIVNHGRVVGRGWTQAGGRPHAEAMALQQAGEGARGGTVYVTLEPCAHDSPRGPACSNLLIGAGVARVVVALIDPDPRTNGKGLARLERARIEVVTGVEVAVARRAMAGFLMRVEQERPFITLKLAMSLDGALARGDGQSQWITGAEARAHVHLERARHGWILVGRGTAAADAPRLDVRLVGLEGRSPRRAMLGSGEAPQGWTRVASPEAVAGLDGNSVMVEGGAATAASFLSVDLIDRLLIYRAPIIVGGGMTLPDIGLTDLAQAHGRWQAVDMRQLGSDRLEVYERRRN